MKKIIPLLLVFFFVTYFLLNKNHCSNTQAKVYEIDNKNYCLLTADSPEEREKGLMFYKKPVDFDGMIFIFPDKQKREFWNKNTYLDLNIYWLDDGRVTGKSLLPSIIKSKEIITVLSTEKVNRVVEIIF